MLKLGGNVDCWCGKCNMILAHTIEAMVKDKPARVHCNTCKAQHTYKPNKPGETSRRPRTGEEGAPRSPQTRKPRAGSYQDLLKDKNIAHAKHYSPKDKYTPGDVVQHPTFGVGVARVVQETKIEVLFEDGPKVLVHGR